ncbi:GpE family phage tail protein [Sphingobium sp. WTD-1]|nr:GpE family phage tail protein [Sphingobium sp. WTD-1]WIA56531.1 GpE family phage tail protein [Sphingobium sp. WTD-1]
MANIAAVFHWPLSELRELDLPELIEWSGRATARFNTMWGGKES